MMNCPRPTVHTYCTYRDETISYLMYHGDQQDDTWIITVLKYKTICFGLNKTVSYNWPPTDLNKELAVLMNLKRGRKLKCVRNLGFFPFSRNNGTWNWKTFMWLMNKYMFDPTSQNFSQLNFNYEIQMQNENWSLRARKCIKLNCEYSASVLL